MILTVTLNPCLDKALWIERNPPVETVRATAVRDLAGGKGVNVSRALVRLGESVTTMMPLGGPSGAWVAELARKEGVSPEVVPIAGTTRCALTLLETTTGQTWHYLEPGPALNPAEVEAIETCYNRLLPSVEMVILSGSMPCLEAVPLVPWMIECAQASEIPIIVDAHGPGLRAALDARPWMVKPNREELAGVLNERLDAPEAQWWALQQLHEQGIEVIALSLGAEGARIQWCDARFEATPPSLTEVNALGSGDAMVAGIATAVRRGDAPRDAIAFGIACGAANASLWDPAGITVASVEELLPRVSVVSVF